MLTTIANIHRSKLPKPGEVGYIILGTDRVKGPRYFADKRKKFIVESLPLCDNVFPYSHGIHTVNVRRLCDGARFRFSGFYFQSSFN
jgi:hypothetical protein